MSPIYDLVKDRRVYSIEADSTVLEAARFMMEHRIGAVFDAVVTGVTPHGTFVRILRPHVEGLLAQGQQGVDVGDKMRVKLIRTDVQHGYIDFARV